jgi:hypothetical protein
MCKDSEPSSTSTRQVSINAGPMPPSTRRHTVANAMPGIGFRHRADTRSRLAQCDSWINGAPRLSSKAR